MLAVERERAKERNSKTAGDDPSKEKFPDTEKGQARDKAAEKVNAGVWGRFEERGCGGAGRSAPLLKNVFAGGCE